MVMPKSIFMEHIQDIFDRASASFFSSSTPSLLSAFGDSLIIGPQNESDGSAPSIESQVKTSEEKKLNTVESDDEFSSFSGDSDYDHLYADQKRNADLKLAYDFKKKHIGGCNLLKWFREILKQVKLPADATHYLHKLINSLLDQVCDDNLYLENLIFTQMDMQWQQLYIEINQKYQDSFKDKDARLLQLVTLCNQIFTSELQGYQMNLRDPSFEYYLLHLLSPDAVIDANAEFRLDDLLKEEIPV